MGDVPQMYWFLFWVAVAVVMFVGMFMAGHKTHIRHMKTLEIMRIYAEKGIEPPASIAEPLLRQSNPQPMAWPAKKERRKSGEAFSFSLTMAVIWGGIAWWRWAEAGGDPKWLFYPAVLFCMISASGAIAALINMIFARRD
jgi:hypothetical protein